MPKNKLRPLSSKKSLLAVIPKSKGSSPKAGTKKPPTRSTSRKKKSKMKTMGQNDLKSLLKNSTAKKKPPLAANSILSNSTLRIPEPSIRVDKLDEKSLKKENPYDVLKPETFLASKSVSEASSSKVSKPNLLASASQVYFQTSVLDSQSLSSSNHQMAPNKIMSFAPNTPKMMSCKKMKISEEFK